MKFCPNCRVQHFDSVDLCDCGYRFSSGRVEQAESAPSKSSPTVKIITWIAIIIFAGIAGSIGRRAARSGAEIAFSGSKGKVTPDVLQQMAEELNSGLPMMVDKETRLDRVSAGPDKKVTYHYTLITLASSDVTPQQLRSAMDDKAKNYVCTTEDMRGFRENGVVVSYSYRGKDGGVIGDISVYPRDCI